MKNERFLQRWARLKRGAPVQALPSGEKDGADVTDLTPENAATVAPAAAPAQSASPSLEDALCLTPDSDYTAFMAQGVDQAVRRLALKRLFTDPHFNLVDGLDIYMGDYNRADPVSAPMLAALHQAQGFLQQVAAEAEKGACASQETEPGRNTAPDVPRQSSGDMS